MHPISILTDKYQISAAIQPNIQIVRSSNDPALAKIATVDFKTLQL